MVQVQVNESNSLLTFRFGGHVDAEEAKAGFQELQSLLPNLKPNFQLLTDLTGLEKMDYACVPSIEKVMDLCREKDVGKIVRVIPDPHKDIGFNIMSLFHYPRGIRIETCTSLEEAEKALDQ